MQRGGLKAMHDARVTGKAGENGQTFSRGVARSSSTRPSAPMCGDTLTALASSCPIWDGEQENLRSGVTDD